VACHESCSAQVEANAICDPPSVRLFADVSVSADVELLVQTIDTHLPHLLAAADAEGRLAVDAVGHLTASARAVAESTLDLDGNSIACVGDATQSSASAAVSLNASFSGSVEVFETCSAHSS